MMQTMIFLIVVAGHIYVNNSAWLHAAGVWRANSLVRSNHQRLLGFCGPLAVLTLSWKVIDVLYNDVCVTLVLPVQRMHITLSPTSIYSCYTCCLLLFCLFQPFIHAIGLEFGPADKQVMEYID